MAQRGPVVSHIGVAVADLSAAIAFYRDVLGLTPRPAEAADQATIVSVPLGDTDIELLSAGPGEGPIARFLAKRGPGIHHICVKVPDLDQALARCREHGYQLIDQRPRAGAGGHRIAFLDPKTTAGILLELTD